MWPKRIIYTGPIDAYFDFRLAPCPIGACHLEHEHLPDVARFQSVGTVNYPNDHAYTRITEFKHLTAQNHAGTSIVREYPQADGDPYYPIPRPVNEELFKRYQRSRRQSPTCYSSDAWPNIATITWTR